MHAAAILLALTIPGGEMTEVLEQDFQSGRIHPGFEIFGPNPAAAIRAERGGLRITLPAKRPDTGPVGLHASFRICGDFEITVSYELLAAEKPESGLGSGVSTWCWIAGDPPHTVSLGQFARPNNDNQIYSQVTSQVDDSDRPFQRECRDATARRGRLRLSRRESTLQLLAADGGSDEFQEIQSMEVGTGDIEKLRISATTSNQPVGVSVRLNELSIRSDMLSIQGSTPPEEPWSLRAWLFGGSCLLLGVAGFLFWRYR